MSYADADTAVHTIARGQYGLVTWAQAHASGLSRSAVHHRVASGRWRRIHQGVYGIAGAPATWEQRLLAACLASGGVASRRAAAALWELGPGRGEVLEVAVPRPRAPRLHGVVVHRATDLDRASVVRRRGIPVTDPSRTIVDLGAVAPPGVVHGAIDDALGRKLVTLAALDAQLAMLSRKGRRGVGVLRQCLAERGVFEPGSPLEALFERILRAHDLPGPVPQYEIRDGDRFVARVDFAYPIARIAVEIDGYRSHSSMDAFEGDRARQNRVVALDWRLLRYTRGDLRERVPAMVGELTRLLGADGPAERERARQEAVRGPGPGSASGGRVDAREAAERHDSSAA